MKRSAQMLFTTILLVLTSSASGQEYSPFGAGETRTPCAVVCVAQTGCALVGGTLVAAGAACVLGATGYAAGQLLFGDGSAGVTVGALAGAAVGYPFGCAAGTATAGRWLNREGNTRGAYLGAYVGAALAASSLLILPRIIPYEMNYYFGAGPYAVALGCVLSPAGAIVGYSLRSSNSNSLNRSEGRLDPPTLSLYRTQDEQRLTRAGVNCRLVTVRF